MATNFKNNLLRLSSITLLSQALALALLPVVTKFYSNEDFGDFGIYIAIVSIFGSCSSLRIESSIPISKNFTDMADNYVVSMLLNVGIAIGVFVVIYFSGYNYFSIELISLGIFFFGLFRIVNLRSVYHNNYNIVSNIKGAQVVSTVLLQVIFGFLLGADGIMLMVSFVVGYAIPSLVVFVYFYRMDDLNDWRGRFNLSNFWVTRKIYVFYESPSIFINSLSNEIATLTVPVLFGGVIAGGYVLAYRILVVPITLLGSTVGTTILGALRLWSVERSLYSNIRKIVIALLLLSGAYFIGVQLFVVLVFDHLFTADWAVAKEVMSIIIIGFCGQMVYSPISVVVPKLKLQKFAFNFHLSMILVRSASLVIGYMLSSWSFALNFYSTISFLMYIYFVLIVMRKAKAEDQRIND